VARAGLPEEATQRERMLIYITEHYEEAGDQLAKQLLQSGADMVERKGKISEEAAADLRLFHEKIVTKSERILEALQSGDRTVAEKCMQLTFKENKLARNLREAQLDRMHSGETVKSNRELLAILAGLVALGGKLNEIADELIREV
jgi:Na+/phosphate symporter